MAVSVQQRNFTGGRRLPLAAFLLAPALGGFFYSPTANAVDLNFDGTRTLVSGNDCEAGARYRFGTTSEFNGKMLDLIVEIVGDDNDYSSDDIPGYDCLGLLVDDPGDPELFSVVGNDGNDNGAADESWSTDLKFSIVEKGTDISITVDRILLTAFDLDIKPATTGADSIFLTDAASIYLDTATEVRTQTVNIQTPAGAKYTKWLLGSNQNDCTPETKTECRGAAVFTQVSEFSLRVANNKSDPGAPRLFQFAFSADYFDEMNLGADYGDAPASYGDAAAEISSAPLLGPGLPPDRDAVPQNSDDASGDDSDNANIRDFDDDEAVTRNGVEFSGQTLYRGSTQTLNVSVYGNGRLNVFIDWNGDGDFDDADEQIITDQVVTTGKYAIEVRPPAHATTGEHFARFRICANANNCSLPSGYAEDGETEDYRFVLADNQARSGGNTADGGEIRTGLDGSGIGGLGWWTLLGIAAIGLRRKLHKNSIK